MMDNDDNSSASSTMMVDVDDFPRGQLVTLQQSVLPAHFEIDVDPTGPLGTCINAALDNFIQGGESVGQGLCNEFVNKTMPICFDKLITSTELQDWDDHVQLKIKQMTLNAIQIAAVALPFDMPGPLRVLSWAFDPDIMFHDYNSDRRADHPGEFANEPIFTATNNSPQAEIMSGSGWVADMINQFGTAGGFKAVRRRCESTDTLNIEVLANLLKPFSTCVDWVSESVFDEVVQPLCDLCFSYIDSICGKTLRMETRSIERNGQLRSAICSMRRVRKRRPSAATQVAKRDIELGSLFLRMLLKILKGDSFNGVMYSLNELKQIINGSIPWSQNPRANIHQYDFISADDLLQWMLEHDLLTMLFKDNLHHAQYVARLEDVVKFLMGQGALTIEHLSAIWNAQTGKHEAIVANIHDLLAKLACKFDTNQLDHLLGCFQKSWGGTAKQMERMLEFIRRLAEDDAEGNVANKVLQLLWNVAHTADAPSEIIEAARTSHVNILTYSYIKDKSVQRRNWITACLKDISDNVCVVHTMKHMEQIVSELAYDDHGELGSSRMSMLQQLDTKMNIRAMLVDNICNYMTKARQVLSDRVDPEASSGQISIETYHTHSGSLCGRLHFLKFFLRHSMLCLEASDALKIWVSLVEQPACALDRETCFEWCTLQAQNVLSQDAINAIFVEKLLLIQPAAFSLPLFRCFRSMFSAVNEENDVIIKEDQHSVTCKLELQGKKLLFAIALQSLDSVIATQAIDLIIRTHTNLSEELLGTCVSLHNSFIVDSGRRIRKARSALYGSGAGQGELDSFQLLIERSLILLTKYVAAWDATYYRRRCFLSHGLSFRGDTFVIQISIPKTNSPTSKIDVHTNETFQYLRERLANQWQMPLSSFQLSLEDQDFDHRNQMLTLTDLNITAGTVLYFRATGECEDENQILHPCDVKEEGRLPALLLAQNVELIEQLFELGGNEQGITSSVRARAIRLLNLIPTIVMKLDKLKAGLTAGSTVSIEALDALFGEDRTFHLLYNVQMIASLLLPAQPTEESAKFRSGFVAAKGARYLLSCIMRVLARISSAGEADTVNYKSVLRLCLQMLSKLLMPPTSVQDQDGKKYAGNNPITNSRNEWTERSKSQLGPDDKLDEVPIALAQLISLASASQMSTDDSEVVNDTSNNDEKLAVEAIQVLSIVFSLSGELCNVFLQSQSGTNLVEEVLLGCEFSSIRSQMCSLLKQLAVQHATSLWGIVKGLLSRRGVLEAHASTCDQFFDLLCDVLQRHGPKLVTEVQLHEHLETELDLLVEYCGINNGKHAMPEMDNSLLTGHLRFCTQIVAMCDVSKKAVVLDRLIDGLFIKILFPASNVLANARSGQAPLRIGQTCHEFQSKSAIRAAYRILEELCTNSPRNFQIVTSLLKKYHFAEKLNLGFDFEPDVSLRKSSGYVGLKNAGATCYMNSVLQQIFMQPEIRKSLLESLDATSNETREDSVLYQMQVLFAHLEKSISQSYCPTGLWKTYRHFGEPVNIREQQDAHDFFLGLSDQIDEKLKAAGKPKILESVFGGSFADQKKIKKGCNHRFEREEPFMTLQVDVKDCASLEESLEQYIKGDLLEGANAYKCEQCNVKRDTVKRMCVKKLPKVLVIHQKRFEFDWEREIPVKCNGFFEFPVNLDMGPYTVEGLDAREMTTSPTNERRSSGESSLIPECKYRLVGVVVHSGQANGGHYYSFIRERYSSAPSHSHNKWLRFDDAEVTEVNIDTEAMKKEFFGGSYTSEVWDNHSRRMVTRQKDRWWNAYMLFYERVSSTECELTQNVMAQLPTNIELAVVEQNIRFQYNREVFNIEYFTFILRLCLCNCDLILAIDRTENNNDLEILGKLTMELMLEFTTEYAFRTDLRVRGSLNEWIRVTEALVKGSALCATHILNFLLDLERNKQFLLQCPNAEVRSTFAHSVLQTIHSFSIHDKTPERALQKAELYFHTCLLPVLEVDLFPFWRNVHEVFGLILYNFCLHGPRHRRLLYELGFANLGMHLWNASISWTKFQLPPCLSLFQFMSSIIRSLTMPQDRDREAGPNNYISLEANPEREGRSMQGFNEPNPSILYANVDLVDKLNESYNLLNAVPFAPDQEELLQAVRFLCFQNKQFYTFAIHEVLKGAYNSQNNDGSWAFKFLTRCLDNEEGDLDQQIPILRSMLVEKDQPPRYVLFHLLNENFINKTVQALRFMVQISERFSQVKDYLKGQSKHRWIWTIKMLAQMIERHYPSGVNLNMLRQLYQQLCNICGGDIECGDASNESDESIDDNTGVVPSG